MCVRVGVKHTEVVSTRIRLHNDDTYITIIIIIICMTDVIINVAVVFGAVIAANAVEDFSLVEFHMALRDFYHTQNNCYSITEQTIVFVH